MDFLVIGHPLSKILGLKVSVGRIRKVAQKSQNIAPLTKTYMGILYEKSTFSIMVQIDI